MNAAILIEAIDNYLEATRREEYDARLFPMERSMEKRLAKAFRVEGQAFLRRLALYANRFPSNLNEAEWAYLLDGAQLETRELFLEAFRTGATAAIAAGIAQAAKKVSASLGNSGNPPVIRPRAGKAEKEPIAVALGIRFDLDNPRAVDYLSRVGADLVTHINSTTRDYIRTVITEGARTGKSYNEMAKAIIDRYAEFAVGVPQKHIASRAHLIAVTEVGQAYSHGNYIVGEELRDAGLVMEKAWDTMGDKNVCGMCQGNEMIGWIPFNNSFPSGHLRPLAHPACRCDMLLRQVGAGR